MTYTKDQVALACLSCGVAGDQIKRILELLPDGETPSLPGQVDRLFYSVPEEKILVPTEAALDEAACQIAGIEEAIRRLLEPAHDAEAALEKAGRQITGVVGPDGC